MPQLIAVTGAVGGSGATTLAVLLASAMTRAAAKVLLLDAAPAGGDLIMRAFGQSRIASPHWQIWVRDGARPVVLERLLVPDVPQLVILSTAPPLSAGAAAGFYETSQMLRTAIAAATAAGWTVILDAGSGAAASPLLAAAVDESAALAITIPQSPGGANRARWFLSGLAARYGRDIVGSATIALTEFTGGHPSVRVAVVEGLRSKVAAVVSVPEDKHLAGGLTINPAAVAAETVAAISAVATQLLRPATATPQI